MLQLFLEIKQNTHDVMVLKAIQEFLGVGSIKPKFDIYNPEAAQEVRPAISLVVRETDKVIEFVDANLMQTSKRLDYQCWKELYALRFKGTHLTEEGVTTIQNIQSTMNSKRVHNL